VQPGGVVRVAHFDDLLADVVIYDFAVVAVVDILFDPDNVIVGPAYDIALSAHHGLWSRTGSGSADGSDDRGR
jgi:hypothetical protein